MTTLIDEACWERGCPCHDDRESKGVAVVRRDWVGLTDEDLATYKSDEFVVFAKEIEAKLKEKNGG
jgi:hypothetical protein